MKVPSGCTKINIKLLPLKKDSAELRLTVLLCFLQLPRRGRVTQSYTLPLEEKKKRRRSLAYLWMTFFFFLMACRSGSRSVT